MTYVLKQVEDGRTLDTFCFTKELGPVVMDSVRELAAALDHWPPMNSAHEGFAVLLEEFHELQAHVFTNQKRRDLSAMRLEAIQVAAMAMRFALEVCTEERGRK